MKFSDALALVLDLEGRTFTNHPLDLGGPTFWGLTQDTYNAYCGFRHLPARQVQTLKPDEIADVYQATFWNLPQDNTGKPISSLLPSPADAVFFQLAVNVGCPMATKLLQAALMVEPDGHFGPVSTKAIASVRAEGLVADLLTAQLAHYATVEEPWDATGLFDRVIKVQEWTTKLAAAGPSSKSTSASSSRPSPSGA